MESFTAFLVLAALVTRFLGKERAAMILFAAGVVFAAFLLHHYATDSLKLAF